MEAPNNNGVCAQDGRLSSLIDNALRERVWPRETSLYCAAVDLNPLVNNNTLTQLGSCSNKNACKSICLGVQDTADASIFTQAADAINLRHVINLSTPILQAY